MNNKGMKQSTKLSIDLITTIIVTLIAGAVTVAAVISMAWFSSNKDVTGTDASVTVQGERYLLSFLTSENPNSGTYETLRQKIADFDDDAVVWQMTASNNIENQNTRQVGIYPGSSGVISFIITPLVDTINLDMTFELCAYVAQDGDGNTIRYFTESTVIDSLSEINNDVSKFLNGHVMFFRNKTVINNKAIYTDPILPDEDGKRVIESETFTPAFTPRQVDIYWVWPLTLSTILDASANTSVETRTFFPGNGESCYDEQATENSVKENILNYPDYYMKGIARPTNESERLSADTIIAQYHHYGDLYDRADNDIGNTVHYLLVKLSCTESEATGGVDDEETP